MRYLAAAVLIIAGVIGYGVYQDRAVAADVARGAARQDSVLHARLAAEKAAQRDSIVADSVRAATRQRTADAVTAYEAARSDAPRPIPVQRKRIVVERNPGATNRAP